MAEKTKPSLRRGRVRAVAATNEFQTLDFGRKNWLLLAIGLGAIVLGFIFLATGDTTFAPVLLVGAYLGVIPWALVARNLRPGEPTKANPNDVDP